MKSLEKFEGSNEDQTVGVRILHRAIEEPLRQIVDNAGEDAAVILNRVKEGKGSFGYNAASGKFGDMRFRLTQACCGAYLESRLIQAVSWVSAM